MLPSRSKTDENRVMDKCWSRGLGDNLIVVGGSENDAFGRDGFGGFRHCSKACRS